MRVAIPMTESWLCPRFDCARRLVLVELNDRRGPERQVVEISSWPAIGRADRLARLGVEVLICGGLCRWDRPALQHARVTVVQDVAGPIDAIVTALSTGRLQPEQDYWSDTQPAPWPALGREHA